MPRLGKLAVVIVAGLYAQSLCQLYAQGTLEDLRYEVRNSPPTAAAPASTSHSSDDDDDDSFVSSLLSESGISELIGAGILMGVTTPFWLPPSLMGDDGTPGYFPNYPYQSGHPGYIIPSPFVVQTNHLGLRLRSEYADDFDGLARAGGHVLLDTKSRWGIDSEFNFRREQLDRQRNDELWTGDFNIVRAFAQYERVQMRTGLGVNWLEDRVGSDFGFNFTYGGDFFPRDPWIFSVELDWGRLGKSSLFHIRSTAGVQFHGFEVYAGYDYFDVGKAEVGNIVCGVRLWF